MRRYYEWVVKGTSLAKKHKKLNIKTTPLGLGDMSEKCWNNCIFHTIRSTPRWCYERVNQEYCQH